MEIEKIKELITAFKEAELTSLSLKCDDFEVKLGKEVTVNALPINVNPVSSSYEVASTVQNTMRTMETNDLGTGNTVSIQGIKTEDTNLLANKCIKSPIVGTFYSASSPGAKPFVTVGSRVKKGDVVCVVEAMKLMNEVEAEEDGEIVEILIQNEEMVEYGQPLFILK